MKAIYIIDLTEYSQKFYEIGIISPLFVSEKIKAECLITFMRQ